MPAKVLPPSTKTPSRTSKKGSAPDFELFSREADRQEEEQLARVTGATSLDDVFQLAEEMVHCQDEAARLSGEAKQYKDRYDQIRIIELPEMMQKKGLVQSNGKGSFTFPLGKIHLEASIKASCTNTNKPKLFDWLRQNALGDVIKEDVSAATLASIVKDRREEGLADPPGLSIFEQVKARFTKAKSK